MFVGRREELELLKGQMNRKFASFVVIKGRRRIGKSWLTQEFSKLFKRKFLFTGLPPTKKTTAESQKKEFVRQMHNQGLPELASDDWGNLFWALGKEVERGPVLIVLDEISWMGSKDPLFLGKLKVAWDQYFELNPRLILVVASSVSSWINKNILKNTGFLGRVDLKLTLDELSMKECVEFWGKRKKNVSSFEKLKVLSVTGGVPKYLSLIDPKLSAEENIKQLCFFDSGFLFNEFDRTFHDLFSRRSTIYKDIVEVLSDVHSLEQAEICRRTKRSNGRVVSEYLKELTDAGFISADFTWDIKTLKTSKLRKYRLRDNYLRFYLKYIFPNKEKILRGRFKEGSLYGTTSWESIMGLQFENLVIHNRHELIKKLNISPEECLYDGPFFQTKTNRQKGCQVDHLIQTKDTLYVCEIKFSKNAIGVEVIEDVKKKVESLALPKLISVRPVLVHVGKVRKNVIEEDYFDKIIDWTELL